MRATAFAIIASAKPRFSMLRRTCARVLGERGFALAGKETHFPLLRKATRPLGDRRAGDALPAICSGCRGGKGGGGGRGWVVRGRA